MLEYSDNYADTTGFSYQSKRPEPRDNNSENVPANTDPNFANIHRIW